MYKIQAEVYKAKYSIEPGVVVVHATMDEEAGDTDTAANTSTEQPVQSSKIDGALETHMNVVPFFAGGMLVLLLSLIHI